MRHDNNSDIEVKVLARDQSSLRAYRIRKQRYWPIICYSIWITRQNLDLFQGFVNIDIFVTKVQTY